MIGSVGYVLLQRLLGLLGLGPARMRRTWRSPDCATTRARAMPWAVLDHLLQLVPCDGVSFNELNVRERQPITLQVTEGGARSLECNFAENDQPPCSEYWLQRESFLPSSYLDRNGDTTSVLRWSDFYTGRVEQCAVLC